jgi:hypothetical protein
MTSPPAIALIVIGAIPLTFLTAGSFFAAAPGGALQSDIPAYRGGDDTLTNARATATDAAERSADPASVDLVRWGSPAGRLEGNAPLEYQLAAVLAKAEQALRSTDEAATRTAMNAVDLLLTDDMRPQIEALPISGSSLVASLRSMVDRLRQHDIWLANRMAIKTRIAEIEAALSGEPTGSGEDRCLDLIRQTISDFPTQVPADSTDEPPNGRTGSEVRDLDRLRTRAAFRKDYHQVRQAEPEARLPALESLLSKYAASPDPADSAIHAQATAELPSVRLEHYRLQAAQSGNAEQLMKNVKRWLEAPAVPGQPDLDRRRAAASELIRSWLGERTALPGRPPALRDLADLQEATIAIGKREERLLGLFRAIDNEKRCRYWASNAQKNERTADGQRKYPRGLHTVEVRNPPGPLPPRLPQWQSEAEHDRAALLGSLTTAPAFVDASAKRAEEMLTYFRTPAHDGILKHPLQDAYDAWGRALEEAVLNGTEQVQAFEAAASRFHLDDLLGR